jgi:uncharacterized protein YndB with AHSA1/START domain
LNETIAGRYVDIVPNEKLSFTWKWVNGRYASNCGVAEIYDFRFQQRFFTFTISDMDSAESSESGFLQQQTALRLYVYRWQSYFEDGYRQHTLGITHRARHNRVQLTKIF